MEKDIALGSVGDLDLAIVGGVASVSVKVGVDSANIKVGASLSVGISDLVVKLFDAIEKASPAGAQPIEEGVKQIVLAAVKAL